LDNAADQGRGSATRAVVDRRQCQQSRSLPRIAALPGRRLHLCRSEIGLERDRDDEPSAFTTLDLNQAVLVRASGNWYKFIFAIIDVSPDINSHEISGDWYHGAQERMSIGEMVEVWIE
jgi:hypothetical protein